MKFLGTFLLIFLTVFTFENTYSQDEPFYNLNSPRNTFKSFLRNMKAYKSGNTDALDKAVSTLDLSHIPPDRRTVVGETKARKLINTLDRLEFIEYEKIPGENFRPRLWTYRAQVMPWKNSNITAIIALARINDEWKFSRDTVNTIEAYESFVKNNDVAEGVIELRDWRTTVKKMAPDWTGEYFTFLKIGQWIGLFALLILGMLISKIFRVYIAGFIRRKFRKNALLVDKEENLNFLNPLGYGLFFLTIFIGVRSLELKGDFLSYILRFAQIALTVSLVWAAVRSVEIIANFFEQKAKKTESKFDDVLIPLLRTGSKIFVFSIGLVFIGHSLTVDVKNIIAGLGIGGLAFALAAKDTLSNLFGSLTVVLDRPFEIGDWVKLGNGVEGNVESVGFRSTRVRTFYDSLVTVPNNNLTNIHIDNLGRRTYRRFTTKVAIQYDTPVEKIEAFCEGIRQIIIKHENTRKDYFNVYLNEMADSSLNIILYLFWKVDDWSQELTEKHRLLIDIIRLGKEIGVEFAFPTQTLHVFNEEKEEIQTIEENAFEVGKNQGQSIAKKPISATLSRSKAIDGELPPVK